MDQYCSIDLEWNASDKIGVIATSAGDVRYSVLGPTAGGCEGPSPEALLVAAIASCYSITLSEILRAAHLPRTRVSVHADGVIVSEAGRARFTRVTVNPTIHGADIPRREAYERTAVAARDECRLGRSIRGNVAYIVGEVSLQRCAE